MRQVHTFCRVCEPHCALVAEVGAAVEGGIRLRPDVEHPVHKGFACHKGLGFTEIHNDPDRLNYPRRRTTPKQAAAAFANIGWGEALDEIASSLSDLCAVYGPEAVGVYFGNPLGFNSTGRDTARKFARALGVRYTFGSGTQDCANKFAAAEAVFGTVNLHPIPDFEHTHYLLDIGSNPRISHMSFVHMTDPMQALRSIVKRGGRVRHVNPRRTESVTPATGDLVQIKPDTDLYLLAAMLDEMHRQGWLDQEALAHHGERSDAMLAFVGQFPPQRAAPVVGVSADLITQLAQEFASAESASIHMSTGVNMGRQGTLAYWLAQMLSLATGNLGRRGGNIYSPGYFPAATVGKARRENPFFDSEFGPLRTVAGNLPANLLAEHIESSKVKALIVIAGNPLLSVGGESRLRKALARLELCVVIDLYPNATAQLADFALPATDWLERADLNSLSLGFQPQPYVQHTEAVTPPKFERKPEWWILANLAERLALPLPVQPDGTGLHVRDDRQLAAADLSLEQLKQSPSRTQMLPPPEPEALFEVGVQRPGGRIDCCPPLFQDALVRAEALFEELAAEPDGLLKLITRRTNTMVNSWFANAAFLKRSHALDNPLCMHPQDAARLKLSADQAVRVRNEHGALTARLAIDETLRPGVVAMTHGWGHGANPELKVANGHPGVNVNALLPRGPGSFEPLSNQAHMTGLPVEVEALA